MRDWMGRAREDWRGIRGIREDGVKGVRFRRWRIRDMLGGGVYRECGELSDGIGVLQIAGRDLSPRLDLVAWRDVYLSELSLHQHRAMIPTVFISSYFTKTTSWIMF